MLNKKRSVVKQGILISLFVIVIASVIYFNLPQETITIKELPPEILPGIIIP